MDQSILDRCAAAALRAIQQNLHSDRLGEIVVLAVVDELETDACDREEAVLLGDVAAGILAGLSSCRSLK